MLIHFTALSRLPGYTANAMQVMKMAEALLGALTACRGETALTEDELRHHFGGAALPRLLLVNAEGRLGSHRHGFHAAWAAWRAGAELVLSRSIAAAAFSAAMGLPTIFECHLPPRAWNFSTGGYCEVDLLPETSSSLR